MLSLYVKEYVTFMYEDCCLSKITVVITNKIVLNCAKKKKKKAKDGHICETAGVLNISLHNYVNKWGDKRLQHMNME